MTIWDSVQQQQTPTSMGAATAQMQDAFCSARSCWGMGLKLSEHTSSITVPRCSNLPPVGYQQVLADPTDQPRPQTDS